MSIEPLFLIHLTNPLYVSVGLTTWNAKKALKSKLLGSKIGLL